MVGKGEEIRLTCKVTGSPQPTIQWFKNELPLDISHRIKSEFDGQNCSLTLAAAELEDAGDYKCVVSNEHGRASSRAEVVISEETKKPKVEEALRDVCAFERGEARFDVRFSGYPKPDIKWYRDGIKIIDGHGKRYRMLQSGNLYSLVISDIRFDDVGIIKCVASNKAGKATSSACLEVKDVQHAPEFVGDEPTDTLFVAEGKDANLRVTVRGNPQPDITWYKDGEILRDTRRIDVRSRGGSSSVGIYNAKGEDGGNYMCEATNVLGKATRTFGVHVRGTYACCVFFCRFMGFESKS